MPGRIGSSPRRVRERARASADRASHRRSGRHGAGRKGGQPLGQARWPVKVPAGEHGLLGLLYGSRKADPAQEEGQRLEQVRGG